MTYFNAFGVVQRLSCPRRIGALSDTAIRPSVCLSKPKQGRSQDFEFRGLKPMASAERERITWVWGQSPQRGPGAEPLLGERGAKPP